MGFFSSLVSFFSEAVSNVSSEIGSVVSAAARDVGVSSSSSKVYFSFGIADYRDNLLPPQFQAPSYETFLHAPGVDIYGQDHGHDPRNIGLAHRFADYFFNVFLQSSEGQAFVQEFGMPNFEQFSVENLGFNIQAATLIDQHTVIMNEKFFHDLLVDPASRYAAFALIAHESIHQGTHLQAPDEDEFSTYTKNSEQLFKRSKEASNRGDYFGSDELKQLALQELLTGFLLYGQNTTDPFNNSRMNNLMRGQRPTIEDIITHSLN